jgi:hypothetical protein
MLRILTVAILMAFAMLTWTVTASASPAPFWRLEVVPAPATMHAGDETGDDFITVAASNLGAVNAEGGTTPIAIADQLPAGFTVLSVSGFVYQMAIGEFGRETQHEMTCTTSPLQCTFNESVLPYAQVVMRIKVGVESSAVSGTDSASITGGGAVGVSASRQVGVGAQEPEFGIDQTSLTAYNEDGSIDTQAGSHPFETVSTITFNEKVKPGNHGPETVGLVKDLHFSLPPGLIGNPTPVPQCSDETFGTFLLGGANKCPADTVIGAVSLTLSNTRGFNTVGALPLFNLVPSPGEPARFGFLANGFVPVIFDTEVATGGGYRVHVNVNDISQYLDFESSTVTFWGVPNADINNPSRGWECLAGGTIFEPEGCQPPSASRSIEPFLSLPTVCNGPMSVNVSGDSWPVPGVLGSKEDRKETQMAGVDGCNHLDFRPSISVAPDGHAGSTPTGLTVGMHVPQISGLNPDGLSPGTVRDTTVTLPDGVAVNPAGADGLLSCSLGQIGLGSEGTGSCPDASKVGTVEITTPLLPHALEGAVYLAAQEANPFGSLLALYLVAEDPVSGVVIKQAGKSNWTR